MKDSELLFMIFAEEVHTLTFGSSGIIYLQTKVLDWLVSNFLLAVYGFIKASKVSIDFFGVFITEVLVTTDV